MKPLPTHLATWCVPALALCLALPLLAAAQAKPAAAVGATSAPSTRNFDVQNALRKLDDLYRSSSSIARMEMTVQTPRRTRTMRMKAWSRGLKRSLIVIEAPARDKGTSTLRVDDNLWNYLPRIARTIRVPPSMMLSSWMGSDFTNDDLVRSSSFAEDFNASILKHDVKASRALIRLDAKSGVVGLWKRIEVLFDVKDPDQPLPLSAVYFDRRLREARTMTFDEIKTFDGRTIPARMSLVPVDKPDHKTIVRYLDIDFEATVPESMFSLARLERSK